MLRRSSNLVLTTAFGFTGAGTVMLGVLLPLLAQQWRLHDGAAGFLLFLQFAGSSLGAICTGANRVRALMLGYGLLIVTAAALAFAAPPAALAVVFAAFFLWGLGLGMAMTGTSLYISDRAGSRRAALLERLNFAWSAGAMAAPVLIIHFVRSRDPRPLYLTFQGLFVLTLLWIALRERQERAPAVEGGAGMPLLVLLLMAMCAVGVESALSGWLTTFSHRVNPADITGGALATSLFWLGMLLSRLLASTLLLALLGRHRLLRATLYGTAISVALLIASEHGWTIDAVAALGGLSIGPVYPLLLSYLLERKSKGWIFAVPGLGSALFPWVTGILSAYCGSLRFGLLAPCAGAAAMVALGWTRRQREWQSAGEAERA